MKKANIYILIVIFLIMGSAYYTYQAGSETKNDDLQNALVAQAQSTLISRFYSWSECDGESFKDYGLPQTEIFCTSDEYCTENWPWGISFKARDNGVCCLDTTSISYGHCGELRDQ